MSNRLGRSRGVFEVPDLHDHGPGDVVNGHRLSAEDHLRPTEDRRGEKEHAKAPLWSLLALQVPFIVGFVWNGWFAEHIDCSASTLTAYECQQQQAFVGGLALFSSVVLWILTNVAVVLTYAIYRKFGDRLLP